MARTERIFRNEAARTGGRRDGTNCELLSLFLSTSTASEACASAEVRAAAPVCARSRSSFSQVLRRTSGRARASQGPARTRIRVDFLARGSSCRLFSPTLPYRLLFLISLAPRLLSFARSLMFLASPLARLSQFRDTGLNIAR